MKKAAQQYSPEFKQAIIAKVEQSGKSMAEVEREHGLTEGLVKQWMRRHRAEGRAAGDAGSAAEVSEVERLRQRNAQLERELEVLKKAIEICSRR